MDTRQWRQSEFFCFDTVNRIRIFHCDGEPLQKAELLCSRLHKLFNRFDPDSEISRLGREVGQWVKISPETGEILRQAQELSLRCRGAFHLAAGTLSSLWGMGGRFEIPEQTEIDAARQRIADCRIAVDGDAAMCSRPVVLDVGGIAKGYAADAICRLMAEEQVCCGLIDLGGNLLPFGEKPDGQPWVVGVRSPFNSEELFTRFQVPSGCSVVTSGKYERQYERGGRRYHHIFDLRTGRPAENPVESVTVLARCSAVADALATAFLCLDAEESRDILKDFPGVEAMFIYENGSFDWAGAATDCGPGE